MRLQDLCCNFVGSQWWVDAMEWERSAEFNAAREEPYEVDGSSAGTVRVAEPLTFVKLADCGHLVRVTFSSCPRLLSDCPLPPCDHCI